jgi:serine/threonine protein kinase/rubrerythrin
MSAERCPRCRERYAGAMVAGEWLTCAQCQHRWMPSKSSLAYTAAQVEDIPLPTIPSATAAAAAAAADRAKTKVETGIKSKSDEYAPDDSEQRRRTAALTNRHDVGDLSSTSAPSQAPLSSSLPGTDPFDPGMFDQMAREAKAERSDERREERREERHEERHEDRIEGFTDKKSITSKSIARKAEPTKERVVTPRLINCPVCGHGFTSTKPNDLPQNCPQCQTNFNIAKGHVSSGAGRAAGSDLLIGRVLRGCLIDRKVGEGGMGAVYHARQLSLDRSVAIKVLPAELARNRNFITRFEREAKSLARINHPNILHIYDFGDEPELGVYFMIIEFVQGRDLGDMLHENYTLGQIEVLDIVRQALLGLETAAAKGVIHRDIKPDNLMITEDGICKVSDFGLAKANSAERDVTSIGVRVGTPAFMSPEQCDGEDVDYRSDIYNLGCTAFLALTGQLPYDADTPFAIMLKHKNEKVPSPKIFNPNLDSRVERLVMRMLAKLPMDRCTDMRDLIEEVEKLEVKLAGTSAVLRKTRGPFKAMSDVDAVASVQEHAKLTSSGIRRTSSSHDFIPSESVPAARPVQTPAPIGAGAIPEWLKPVENAKRKTTAHLTPDPTPTARLVPLTGTTSQPDMKELRNKIAEAKTRHIQDEVEQLRQEGERLAASGQREQAASSFMRAAVLTPNAKESQELMVRATRMRRGSGIGKFIKRVVILSALVAAGGAATFFGVPVGHNLLAEQQLAPLQQISIPAVRLQAYGQFITDYGTPLPWYEKIFHQSYQIVAVERARKDMHTLRAELAPKVSSEPIKPSKADQEIELLERMKNDNTVGWQLVAVQARRVLEQGEAKERARPYLDLAEKHVAAMDYDLGKIRQQWQAGKQGDAARLAERFRAQYPRAGTAMPIALLGSLSVVDKESQLVPMGLKITTQVIVQDKALPNGVFTGTNVLADGEFEFCRYDKYQVKIELSAPGYRSENITIPAQADTQVPPFVVSMVPGIAWQAEVQKMPRFMSMQVLPESDHLGFIRAPERIALFDFGNGRFGQTLTRGNIPIPVSAAAEPATWTEAWDQESGFHIAGTSDGVAIGVRITPQEITLGNLAHRGNQPVLAYRSKELTFQAGVQVAYVVNAVGQSLHVQAKTREKDLWTFTQLQGFQRPQLWFQDDQVIVADDRRIVVCDETSGEIRSEFPFMEERTGPIVLLAPHIYALATKQGIHVLEWQGQKFAPLMDKYLSQINGRLFHAAQQTLTVIVGDRTVQRFTWRNKQSEPRWTLSLSETKSSITHVGYDNNCVLTADSEGVVTLINDQDGKIIRRIAHSAPLIDAPRIVQGRLIVADRAGKISAYYLP